MTDLSIFDVWNKKKKTTHENISCPHFSIGEIWWAQLGKNIATEIEGKGKDFLRPAVIIQKLYGNACFVVPLTSKDRYSDYYFSFVDTREKKQCALLPQVRYIDGKRLKYKLSSIKKEDFNLLCYALCSLIKK